MVVLTGWLFASSCSPPRLSATQFLSATKGQLPLRSALSPNCWCLLVGALAAASPPPWATLPGDGDIAATAKDRTRVGGLARRNDVKRAAANSNLSRPLCQGPVDRRLPQPPRQLTAPRTPHRECGVWLFNLRPSLKSVDGQDRSLFGCGLAALGQSVDPRQLEAERADKVSIALRGFFRRAHAREHILFDNAPAVVLEYFELLHES